MRGCRIIWFWCAPSHIKETHKKLIAPVTLDPTPEDLEAQECVRSHFAKIEKDLLGGGATAVKRY